MDRKDLASLIARYAILIILGLFNLAVFYFIFTPLTIYPVYFFLSLIFEKVSLISVSPTPAIAFKDYMYVARIIPACIAGSAYYLLLILNLATPMKLLKRIPSLLFLFAAFLAINIARIVTFAALVPVGYQYFDATHELSWYFGSTIMIVLIWFLSVFLFKIKEIPVYSDIKNIISDVKSPDKKEK